MIIHPDSAGQPGSPALTQEAWSDAARAAAAAGRHARAKGKPSRPAAQKTYATARGHKGKAAAKWMARRAAAKSADRLTVARLAANAAAWGMLRR